MDAIAIGFARANVGYVKRFAIVCADNPVRLFQIADNPTEFLAVRRQVIDAFELLFGTAVPIGALVKGIGEKQATIGREPDIVWAVEEFALVISQRNRNVSSWTDSPE